MRLRSDQTEMTKTFIRMLEKSGFTYCEVCSDEHGAMMHYPDERCPRSDTDSPQNKLDILEDEYAALSSAWYQLLDDYAALRDKYSQSDAEGKHG